MTWTENDSESLALIALALTRLVELQEQRSSAVNLSHAQDARFL